MLRAFCNGRNAMAQAFFFVMLDKVAPCMTCHFSHLSCSVVADISFRWYSSVDRCFEERQQLSRNRHGFGGRSGCHAAVWWGQTRQQDHVGRTCPRNTFLQEVSFYRCKPTSSSHMVHCRTFPLSAIKLSQRWHTKVDAM